jgi:hypothetical protein
MAEEIFELWLGLRAKEEAGGFEGGEVSRERWRGRPERTRKRGQFLTSDRQQRVNPSRAQNRALGLQLLNSLFELLAFRHELIG